MGLANYLTNLKYLKFTLSDYPNEFASSKYEQFMNLTGFLAQLPNPQMLVQLNLNLPCVSTYNYEHMRNEILAPHMDFVDFLNNCENLQKFALTIFDPGYYIYDELGHFIQRRISLREIELRVRGEHVVDLYAVHYILKNNYLKTIKIDLKSLYFSDFEEKEVLPPNIYRRIYSPPVRQFAALSNALKHNVGAEKLRFSFNMQKYYSQKYHLADLREPVAHNFDKNLLRMFVWGLSQNKTLKSVRLNFDNLDLTRRDWSKIHNYFAKNMSLLRINPISKKPGVVIPENISDLNRSLAKNIRFQAFMKEIAERTKLTPNNHLSMPNIATLISYKVLDEYFLFAYMRKIYPISVQYVDAHFMFKILIAVLDNTKVHTLPGPIIQFLNPKDIVNLQRVKGGGFFRQALKNQQKNCNVIDHDSLTNETCDQLIIAINS